MLTRNVRVHSCYSIEMNEPRPVPCDCRKFLSVDDADALVRKGLAQYVVGYDRPKLYEDGSQVCLVGRQKKTPRGATIEKAHMERAYVDGDLEEQYRINMYGFLTLMARISVGKKFVLLGAEPECGREEDYGRPILYFPCDQRTN